MTPPASMSIAPIQGERLSEEILSPDAIEFVSELHRKFGARRAELLMARTQRPAPTGFLAETAEIRQADWRVAAPLPDYVDRRVEITGPTDRKLVINALNSGAKGFMADFEDANSPTWHNQVSGHANLIDAIDGTISYDSSDGRHYELGEQLATLLVRPRGWHLPEKHALVDAAPIAGALFDFGLYVHHCAARLRDSGRGVYLYLPKLEHYLEARLWNDVLGFAEEVLSLARGTLRATVLIETLPAAFQMQEILFELREHSYGMNAGRWDYIFSTIKCYRDDPAFVLPDRNDVKMTVPFIRAYTRLLVETCHARGAFAMGGMAALIPSRTDPAVNDEAIEALRVDKHREATDGFDGTWVAHPDVVATAMAEFDAVLGPRPNQIDRRVEDADVGPRELLNVAGTPGAITEAGLRSNVSVAFRYISFWLTGRGAAGINGLMEDTATAEICRSQIWQWVRHDARLAEGQAVSAELVLQILDEEMGRIREDVGERLWQQGRPEETRQVFLEVALGPTLPEFLTSSAYAMLD